MSPRPLGWEEKGKTLVGRAQFKDSPTACAEYAGHEREIVNKQMGNRTGQKKSRVPCFYSQMNLSSWNSLRKLYEQNTNRWNGWLFCGQIIPKGSRKSRCPLETSLERGMSRFNIPLSKARIWEYRLLRDFKRRYHLVNDQPLDQKNSMEWLALLRHYGGPARLNGLDLFILGRSSFCCRSGKGRRHLRNLGS